MSIYVKVIGPGRRERLVKRKHASVLIAEGAVPAGEMEGYECIVFKRSAEHLRAVSGQARRATGDLSTRIYAPGQRMGNCYELAGV